MPLTHVCMWSEHGWKRVTATEAIRHGASSTVSARSGLFMCELCGQYVTLAYGMIRDPYFKHSSEELSKDCQERTFSTSAPMSFQAGTHGLPLRIRIKSASQFELQLGLLPVLGNLLSDNHKILISSPETTTFKYEYSTSRIEDGVITYFSVGSNPMSSYRISVIPADDRLRSYWPGVIEGVARTGTLFDSITGKKLPYDADTLVNHTYWLLSSRTIYQKYQNVIVKQICNCSVGYSRWHVYEVTATAFAEDAARFFLDYHCRLTENAVSITPLWPVYIETPYVIRHGSNQLAVFLRGDADPKVFPITYLHRFRCGDGQLFFVNCKERQQFLSAGRTKVLRYTYLWKDPLDYSVPCPEVEVTDISGNLVQPGNQAELPRKNTIIISAPFDGYAIVKRNKVTIEKYQITSSKKTVIEKLKSTYSVEVFQGQDLVWEVSYSSPTVQGLGRDFELREKLIQCGGPTISVYHSLGSLAAKMGAYPLTKQWLYERIRDGKMSERAYKMLTNHFASNE